MEQRALQAECDLKKEQDEVSRLKQEQQVLQEECQLM